MRRSPEAATAACSSSAAFRVAYRDALSLALAMLVAREMR
jgi:hypothetical protein